jgi:formylglycine-generating enzyme required for sulfatase activity
LASLHQAVNIYVRRVRQAGPDAAGFFYYSGHGAADGATNYLTHRREDDQLWDHSLRLISKRVVRGGSWHSGPQFLRSATRNWGEAVDRANIVGFRVGRTLNP